MKQLDRRTVLRGLGASVSLPLLEAMLPSAFARGPRPAPPVRLAFLFVPNGMHMPDWTPWGPGALPDELPYLMEPLAAHRDDLLILSGLTQDKARANGDGPGDHARSAAAFLTGAQPKKTAGDDIRVGISADQIAAKGIGGLTRFRSLELGCERGRRSGQCDSGYACVYSGNIAWKTPHTPMTKETNPALVFDRLFGAEGGTPEERAERARRRRSILDHVRGDAADLKRRLGSSDQRKLDEYLSGVRELERRVEQTLVAAEEAPEYDRPAGSPKDYATHIRLMGDLLVLAFQADLTRVATFMFANEGSNRSYADIGIPEGHHTLSHHGGDRGKIEKIREINRFHAHQLAYILERLKAADGGEGASLLDQSMIVYGSGISDGNRHNHDELPMLVAGRGGGTLETGRHVRFAPETPANNFFLALLDRMGVKAPLFGDATGRVELS